MNYIAIALALGDLYDNAGTGKLVTPHDGAIDRFHAVTESIPCGWSSIVICTAGYNKADPRRAHEGRRVSLADQLARYVAETDSPWADRLIATPLCWSTRNEIRPVRCDNECCRLVGAEAAA